MFIEKKIHYVLLTVLIFLFLLSFGDCSGIAIDLDGSDNMPTITSFVFEVNSNPGVSLSADAVGIIEGQTIKVGLPQTVSRAALVPTITTSTGATVDPGSGVVQDFTNSLTYTVQSVENNNSTTYEVFILSSDNNIFSFSFLALDNQDSLTSDIVGTINLDSTISVVLPNPPADFRFIPLIILSDGASIEPRSGLEQDYSRPVKYVVTAENGESKEYIIETSVTGFTSEKDITEFVLESSLNPELTDNAVGIINGTDIELTVPNNVNISSLIPTITTNGVSVFPESGTPQNFDVPILYEVTADDQTTKIYTVSVTLLSSDNYITAFRFDESKNNMLGQVYQGNIVDNTISVSVYSGVNITELIPAISISEGASISPNLNQAMDFSTPQTYTVTAEDGSARTYTVQVNVLNTFLAYKGDSPIESRQWLSIGDYNNEYLIAGNGFDDFVLQSLYYKIVISDDNTILYDSTVRVLPEVVSVTGSLHFGIDGWSFSEWNASSENLYLYGILYASDGSTEIARIDKEVQKSPYSDIYTWRDLQNIDDKLDGNYSIKNDIAVPPAGTWGVPPDGFTPIGFTVISDVYRPFTGSLKGNGYTISNLYIDGVDAVYTETGLFAVIDQAGTEPAIDDLTIQLRFSPINDPSISGLSKVGAFAGVVLSGELRNIVLDNPAGRVSGGDRTGGLVGELNGSIIGKNNSIVEGSNNTGGIAGYVHPGSNIIAINDGDVTSGDIAGGMVGYNMGTLIGRNSGQVTGKSFVGGLVGVNGGNITGINSGNLVLEQYGGGLVGKFTKGTVVGYAHNMRFSISPTSELYFIGYIHGGVFGELGDTRTTVGYVTGISGTLPTTTNGIGVLGMPGDTTFANFANAANLEQRSDGFRYYDDGDPITINPQIKVFISPYVFGTETGNWIWTDGQMPELVLPIN